MLAAHGLCVMLGGRAIVDGIDLDVVPGRVVVVAGANGAGKSTVLRALAGELRPSAGSVSMNGADLARLAVRETARSRAVLRQSTTVAFPMTVEQVALLGRIPHNAGLETAHDRDVVHETLRRTGVVHLATRSYSSLSGGEKQRVQLARVLAQIFDEVGGAPRYLLLDEPTAGLDLEHQHVCLRLARRAAGRGIGVLAVLHDLVLAARYADTVVLLRGGRVVASGPTSEVLTPLRIETVFGVRSRARVHPRSGRLLLTLGGPATSPRGSRVASLHERSA